MSFRETIKGWIAMLFANRVKEEFHAVPYPSKGMTEYVSDCMKVYEGHPDWVDADNHIFTVNFAKSVCSEVARLTTLDIGITVDGSARAKWIQTVLDNNFFNLRHEVEYGCGGGTVILKPNGEYIDIATPNDFIILNAENGEITDIVFRDIRYNPENERWYTRFERHTLKDGNYHVANRCFMGNTRNGSGKAVAIETTPWIGIQEDVDISGVDRMLFGIFRTPQANNIDINSPLGMPIFAEAMEELKTLDIAFSRNAKEIYDSKRLVIMDSDRLMTGQGTKISAANMQTLADGMGLPDYVKMVFGEGEGDVYHEINPSLNTDVRLTGINSLLSQIGFKCGFSNGYFVFNEKTGMVTATQVESDDRRTVQLIHDMRDKLKDCLDGLIYALDKFADLYALAPSGAYEVTYDFSDITYSLEEDRVKWYGYVTAGKVPFWYYLTKFEGFSEEEAKAIEAAAREQKTLYEEEE